MAAPVTNTALAQRLLAAMRNRYVDVMGWGDSNQVFQGFGNDHGWQYALANFFGFNTSMYATGLITAFENNEAGAGQGFSYYRGSLGAMAAAGTPNGAPAGEYLFWNDANTALADADRMTRHRYAHITADFAAATGGITLETGIPGATTAPWKAYLSHIRFSGGGSYRPTWRNTGSGGVDQWGSGAIDTNNATSGYQIVTDTITPGHISSAAQSIQLCVRFTNAVTPNIVLGFQRCQNTALTAGWAYTTVGYMGGKSMLDQTVAADAISYESWGHIFDVIRQPQLDAGLAPIVIIIIQSGLNDLNATGMSRDVVNLSNTKAGFKSNMLYELNLIRDQYDALYGNGADGTGNLYFGLARSHCIADNSGQAEWASEVTMKSYADALAEVASDPAYSPYTFAWDPSAMASRAEILAVNGYAAGPDYNHLVQAGSQFLFPRVVQQLANGGGSGRFQRFARNERFGRF